MLLEAVHRVNIPRAAALLLRGADVNMTDAQGVTPLIIACERGEGIFDFWFVIPRRQPVSLSRRREKTMAHRSMVGRHGETHREKGFRSEAQPVPRPSC